MNNTLTDLNNHLFAQLERLGEEELTADQLKVEIERGKAMSMIAGQIISNGALALKAEEMRLEYNCKESAKLPKFLGGDNE